MSDSPQHPTPPSTDPSAAVPEPGQAAETTPPAAPLTTRDTLEADAAVPAEPEAADPSEDETPTRPTPPDPETVRRPDKATTDVLDPLILEAPTRSVDYTFTGELSDSVTRPLQPEAAIDLTGQTHLIFAQATDVGRQRANNEDAVFSFLSTARTADDLPDFGLFVVADGLGGHMDGEKASSLSARTLALQIIKALYLPLLLDDRDDRPINEIIEEAVHRAHHEIQLRVPQGSTTCTAVVVLGDVAHIAHVGDSRVYLVQRGQIEQLTRDHSVVQRLIELDHISAEEASSYQNRNYLYRALGQNEDLEVDILRRRLPPGSSLILCSDGLWGQVKESEIVEALQRTNGPQEACFQLVALANARGGVDNVTVTILQMPK